MAFSPLRPPNSLTQLQHNICHAINISWPYDSHKIRHSCQLINDSFHSISRFWSDHLALAKFKKKPNCCLIRLMLHMEGQQLRHDPIQYTLVLHWTGLWATGNTLQRLPESYKAGIISWWNLLDPLGVPTPTPWDHLRWLCVTLAKYCCPVWQRSTR